MVLKIIEKDLIPKYKKLYEQLKLNNTHFIKLIFQIIYFYYLI